MDGAGMGKVFLLAVFLGGCGGASDYSDAELLADSERRIANSHSLYRLRQPNGGGELIVSAVNPVRETSLLRQFQLTLSPAAVLATGQLFSAVIYSPTQPNPTGNRLVVYDNTGALHEQTMLAQWRKHGNIFAISTKKQKTHMFAELFFLRSALLHGGVSSLGGYAQGAKCRCMS